MSKSVVILLLFAFSARCLCDSDTYLHPILLDFDEIKNELISKSNFSHIKDTFSLNNVRCAYELFRIQKSLKKHEQWAIRGILRKSKASFE